MRPIPDEMKARFHLLLQTAQDERLFIPNCPELDSGRPAYLVCEALPIHGTDQVDLLPLAEMIDDAATEAASVALAKKMFSG